MTRKLAALLGSIALALTPAYAQQAADTTNSAASIYSSGLAPKTFGGAPGEEPYGHGALSASTTYFPSIAAAAASGIPLVAPPSVTSLYGGVPYGTMVAYTGTVSPVQAYTEGGDSGFSALRTQQSYLGGANRGAGAAQSAIHDQTTFAGSGVIGEPNADFAHSFSLVKKGWPYYYAVAGEGDTMRCDGRNTGPATTITNATAASTTSSITIPSTATAAIVAGATITGAGVPSGSTTVPTSQAVNIANNALLTFTPTGAGQSDMNCLSINLQNTKGSGYLAGIEGGVTDIDPNNAYAIDHNVGFQHGVVNSRDGDYEGSLVASNNGANNVAYHASGSANGSNFSLFLKDTSYCANASGSLQDVMTTDTATGTTTWAPCPSTPGGAVTKSSFGPDANGNLVVKNNAGTVVVTIDQGGNVASNGTPILPNFSYATLQTVSASTKGRESFCNDCLKPGEAAGAGTGMLVFSDGRSTTSWFTTAGTAIAH